jgi:hypothetical protein
MSIACYWFSICAVSVISPKNDRRISQNNDFVTAKSWGIPFVTQKCTRSGSLFLSDGQNVGSPVDIRFKLFLSIVLSSSRPLGVMNLNPRHYALRCSILLQ